jgi:hypothetical protein
MRERERDRCVKYKSLSQKDQANNHNYEERCVNYSYNKSQRDALRISQLYFGKELYMFRTDLLSIIRSINTVFTLISNCHASYVDCLLARLGWTSLADSQHNYCCEYSIKTPGDGQ